MISKTETKYIQSLAHKKFRDETGCFVVEGEKMVMEWLEQFPGQLIKVYATKKWLDREVYNWPTQLEVVPLEDAEMEKISFLSTPGDLLALVRTRVNVLEDLDPNASMVILDQIQDPGNLGTIIRSCDWFGVTQLVCSPHTVDALNPKVVQSAMGSLLRVNIIYADLKTLFEKGIDMPVYAAVLGGSSLYDQKVTTPFALIVGNESRGISSGLLQYATAGITIPRTGKAESLNAAVATAVLLSYLTRQP
jgi:RNA methyltransferase, TrmH family